MPLSRRDPDVCEKARDRVPEHETILPAMRGGRRFQENDLDSGAAERGLDHPPA